MLNNSIFEAVREGMKLRFLSMSAGLLCASALCAPASLAARPVQPPLPGESAEYQEPAPSMIGELVDRTSDAVTLEDSAGEKHTFRLTERTRYVYGMSSSPSDFRVGARVRAEYAPWSADRVALALWVLGGPSR
jgi:hypothetical protein